MSCQIVSGNCHLAERKNGNFATLQWLSPNRDELDEEVATCLLVNRPLLDDGLFVDQSEMILTCWIIFTTSISLLTQRRSAMLVCNLRLWVTWLGPIYFDVHSLTLRRCNIYLLFFFCV
ncbi:unnamed protein product [Spirodela intermedia]|uniref:Uncharacterized protein n=1 Tax=Spirodela intermedia TaxID=51605 RepID=A0A7I8K008_SPIIN|nr:unnamed protein product [Spirodela intermedia]